LRTAWEIATLTARGRITPATEPRWWLATAGRIGPVEFVPADNEIAVRSAQLGDMIHKDPSDRFIVATCMKPGVPPVTAGDTIGRYARVTTIR